MNFHTMMKSLLSVLLLSASFGLAENRTESTARAVTESLDIAPVWAAHPVGIALFTHAPFQFVAFYDATRQLTVGRRKLGDRQWQFTKLPVTTGWDSFVLRPLQRSAALGKRRRQAIDPTLAPE